MNAAGIYGRLCLFGLISIFCVPAFSIAWSPIDGQIAVEQQIGSFGTLFSFKAGMAAYCLAVILWAGHARTALLSMPPVIALLCLWLAVSCVWSLDPIDSLFHAAVLTALLTAPALMAGVLGRRRALLWVWAASAAVAALSLALGLSVSPYGTMGGAHQGLWRGVFVHKNHYGVFLSFFLVWTIFACPAVPRAVRLLAVAVALVSLVMSGSSAAYLLTLAGLAFAAIVQVTAKGPLRGFLSIAAVIYASVLVLLAGSLLWEPVLEALGRDATLTGRTKLWGAALSNGMDRFWGFGYRTGGGESVLWDMRHQSGWPAAPSTHNGYLTLLLDGGVPAVFLWCLWLLLNWLQIMQADRTPPGSKAAATGFTVIFLANGFVDSASTAYGSFGLFLFFLLLAAEISPRPAKARAGRSAEQKQPETEPEERALRSSAGAG